MVIAIGSDHGGLKLKTDIVNHLKERGIEVLDKDYRKVIDITMPLAKHVFTVATPDNPRAMDAKELCEEVKRVNSNAEYSDSVEYAVNKTKEMMGKDDLLVIFGSLSFLKDARKAVLGL